MAGEHLIDAVKKYTEKQGAAPLASINQLPAPCHDP
jgi:hypothetical protein